MSIEGRWKIARCACSVATVKGGVELPAPCAEHGEITYVPVVPCDDAAVKRATLTLYERLNPPGLPQSQLAAEWYCETAEAVLRAAGGQDAS